jgi:putative DNA methylase
VAVLLNKVVLEYSPQFRDRLADEVQRWGEWVKEQAHRELNSFYPAEPHRKVAIAYVWARTILSEAPGDDRVPVEVPLLRSMWVAHRSGRNWALRWKRDSKGSVQVETVDRRFADGTVRRVKQPILELFQPRDGRELDAGTSAGGAATCPVTGFTTPVESVRTQLVARRGGAADARLVYVVTGSMDEQGRSYRLPTKADLDTARAAEDELSRHISLSPGGLPLIPEAPLNHLRGFFNVVLYGMKTWGDLFSPRQLLTLVTLTKSITDAGSRLRDESPELARAVQTCLALALDRQADRLSSLARWDSGWTKIANTFGRQALPMVWDFAEANPFSGATGDWSGAVEWVVDVCRTVATSAANVGHAQMASATAHPLPTDAAQAIVTDPPYYAAVPYADLSDFFYSWLRRSLRGLYPDLLDAPTVPKDEEIVSLSHRAAMYREKNNAWFEAKMGSACAEGRRVCEPSGIGVYVFASKETPAWEAMLNALVGAGWVVTASWPIDTEMGNRLRARNSATLASSVHIVCRPRENSDGSLSVDSVGAWRDVLSELPRRIHDWMPRLAAEGIVGADAIFACLGPALEVFTRYSRVEKASGEAISLKEYLEHVWAAVSREALSMMFEGADASGLEEDARLSAIWLWTNSVATNGVAKGGAGGNDDADVEDAPSDDTEENDRTPKDAAGVIVEFDVARKIAQGIGARLEALTHLVEVKGAKARLLSVAERSGYLFGRAEGVPTAKKTAKKRQMTLFTELEQVAEAQGWGEVGAPKAGRTTLDRVHQAMLLFGAGRGEALKRFLIEEGVGKQGQFWKLAQSLSALYPSGSDEKRWVDGVLARKKSLGFG